MEQLYSISYIASPAKIIEPPTNVKVVAGETALFFCRATGNPAPTVNFLLDRTISHSRLRVGVNIPDGSLLRLTKTTTEQNGMQVQCVARNHVGGDSAIAHLTVYDVNSDLPQGYPILHSPPKPTSATIGDVAQLECEVSGNPQPEVVWIKNEIPIPTNGPRISIAGSGSLRFEHLLLSDEGHYECLVTNALGSVLSSKAFLGVKKSMDNTNESKMVFYWKSQTEQLQTVGQGSKTLICILSSRTRLPELSGILIGYYSNESYKAILQIPSIHRYTDTYFDPRIIDKTDQVRVRPGQGANLTCRATGNPIPSTRWLTDSENPITESVEGVATLFLTDVTGPARYICEANNSLGTVQHPVRIYLRSLQQKRNLIRYLTESAMKICSPDCLEEELKFLGRTFLQNGYSERFTIKTMHSVKPEPTQYSVRKKQVYIRLPFKPHYQNLLEGQIATFYHQLLCVLICMLVPSIMRWSYDKAFVGQNARTQSRISEWQLEETRLKRDCITSGRNRQGASLHHHIPGISEPIKTGTIQPTIDRRGDWNPTAGSATLHPKETCATSELELAYETSGPTNVPPPPLNLKCLEEGAFHAFLQWYPPDFSRKPSFKGQEKPTIDSYTLFLTESNGTHGTVAKRQLTDIASKQFHPDGALQYKVVDLKPYTQYSAEVVAVSHTHGMSDPSNTAFFTTAEFAPSSAPLMVSAVALLDDTVDVTWHPPKNANGKITIIVRMHHRIWDHQLTSSYPILVAPSSAPLMVSAVALLDDTVDVTWHPPKNANGKI
ncbi:hypothetical protein T265_12473, partial [Opisthorchis viverrini]